MFHIIFERNLIFLAILNILSVITSTINMRYKRIDISSVSQLGNDLILKEQDLLGINTNSIRCLVTCTNYDGCRSILFGPNRSCILIGDATLPGVQINEDNFTQDGVLFYTYGKFSYMP